MIDKDDLRIKLADSGEYNENSKEFHDLVNQKFQERVKAFTNFQNT